MTKIPEAEGLEEEILISIREELQIEKQETETRLQYRLNINSNFLGTVIIEYETVNYVKRIKKMTYKGVLPKNPQQKITLEALAEPLYELRSLNRKEPNNTIKNPLCRTDNLYPSIKFATYEISGTDKHHGLRELMHLATRQS